MRNNILWLVALVLLPGCRGGVPTPTALTPRVPATSIQSSATVLPTERATTQPAARSTLPAPESSTTRPAPSLAAATSLPTPTQIAVSATPAATNLPSGLSRPAVTARLPLRVLAGEARAPVSLAQAGGRLYVANTQTSNIAIIEGDRVAAVIPLEEAPSRLVADPLRGRIYSAASNGHQVVSLNGPVVEKMVVVRGHPEALAFFEGKLYVGLDTSELLWLDGATLAEAGSLKLAGAGILTLALDQPRGLMYVSTFDRVMVIDLRSGAVRAVPVVGYFSTMAVSPATGSLWLAGYDSAASQELLSEYDPSSGAALAQIPMGGELSAAIFDSQGRFVYAADSFNNEVAVIEAVSRKVVSRVTTGLNPRALMLDETGARLYVANKGSSNIDVIDTRELGVRATVALGMSIEQLVADERRGRLYAVSSSTGSVFVVEQGRVRRELSVGRHPVSAARDPQTNRLFVASAADGAMVVIDENNLTIQGSSVITHNLSDVQVDPINRRLFAGSTMYDLDTLQPLARFQAKGFTVSGQQPVGRMLVVPRTGKVYAEGSNGIPGSNGRTVLYAFMENDPHFQKMLGGGNVTAEVVDPDTGRLFATSTHPLVHTNWLDLWEANDEHVFTLALSGRTLGMAINPHTHHLFLSHAHSVDPRPGSPSNVDNTVEVLDTRTLGQVALLGVPGSPGPMTVLGDQVFVAGADDGYLTEITDAAAPIPPSPTLTKTPTAYPSSTPTP